MSSRAVLVIALIVGAVCAGSTARSAGPVHQAQRVASIRPSGISWQEGKNYETVTPASPDARTSGKVEVLEFFQYTCPHCYTFESHLVFWKRMRADIATVTRVPVAYKPMQRSLARLYYTLEALGRIDTPSRADLHHDVFDVLHRVGATAMAANDEEEGYRAQLEFAVASGIDAAEFTKVYRSPGIEAKVKRAEALAKAYRITGTPMFVVGGRYKTDVAKAGDEYRLMSLLADLAIRSASQSR